MKKTICVIGGSGFLGWTLLHQARLDYHCLATYHQHAFSLDGVKTIRYDLKTGEGAEQITAAKPSIIFCLAALSNPNFCETHPDESFSVNVQGMQGVTALANDIGARLVFTSTDLVFDGESAPYNETATPKPVSIYGQHKWQAETHILQNSKEPVVCRMPLMFGKPSPYHNSFLQGMLKQWVAGGDVPLFTDEIRTPVDAEDAAKGLLWAAEHVNGLVHLGGRSAISRYELGKKIAEIAQLPLKQIIAKKQADVTFAAKRPSNVSLDSRYAFAAGFKPATLDEQLARTLKAMIV